MEISDRASESALTHFEAGAAAMLKADGTRVTEADRAVEQLLQAALTEATPDDRVLGEELGQVGHSERVWILDPIDGASFFARGDPNWRIHIALQHSLSIEVAVVTAPVLGPRWWATRGGGAFKQSRPGAAARPTPLAVTNTLDVAEAVVDAFPEGCALPPPGGCVASPVLRTWVRVG